jgi:hypothetical protein
MQALLLFCFAAGSYAEQDLPLLARPVTPLTLNTPRLFLPHIQTGAMAEYFVSTTGSDTTGDGSADKPWATMDHARLAVRALIADGMTGDVFVYFSSGVYSLSEPVTFDPQDSATAPFTIHYSTNPADPDAPAVISGGTVVPGPWKPAPSGPAFMASYSGPQSRQLFINAQRAPPARFNASFMKAVGNLTDVGYHLFNDDTVLRWAVAQPGGEPLELVYTGVGSSWTEARCRTDSVTSDGAGGTVIVMQQPCWANGRARGGSQNSYQAISWPATIENVAAGLAYGGDSFLSPGTDVRAPAASSALSRTNHSYPPRFPPGRLLRPAAWRGHERAQHARCHPDCGLAPRPCGHARIRRRPTDLRLRALLRRPRL